MKRILVATAMMVGVVGHGVTARAISIPVQNHSFEDVQTYLLGGVWPEVDADPVNADYWLEFGPVGGELNAFPESLIPPGFILPDDATLDTGVFFNSPVYEQDGQFIPSPAYITNAHGNQVAYMFASSTLDPGVGFRQVLDTTYEAGLSYLLTVAVGKSFYLPPTGGSTSDPSMGIRLLYEDGEGQWQVLAEQVVYVSQVESTLLTDFTTQTGLLDEASAAIGARIGIEFVPLDGTSGVWTLDNVRLEAIPEPATAALLTVAGAGLLMRRRR